MLCDFYENTSKDEEFFLQNINNYFQVSIIDGATCAFVYFSICIAPDCKINFNTAIRKWRAQCWEVSWLSHSAKFNPKIWKNLVWKLTDVQYKWCLLWYQFGTNYFHSPEENFIFRSILILSSLLYNNYLILYTIFGHLVYIMCKKKKIITIVRQWTEEYQAFVRNFFFQVTKLEENVRKRNLNSWLIKFNKTRFQK